MNKIQKLLQAGKSYDQIIGEIGCSRSTISYHAHKVGKGTRRLNKVVDWTIVQKEYDSGKSLRTCAEQFDYPMSASTRAVKRGDLILRPKRSCIELVFIKNSTVVRSVVKNRILADNLIPYVCEQCDAEPEWKGKPLTLVLDHINGVNNDHRLENLRFLCPNCNSQADTFAGRNKNASLV